jgi:hypothetical protein
MSEPESQPFLKTAQSRRPLQIWVLGVDLDLARLGMLGLELDSPVRCSGSGWTWIRRCSGGAGFARGRRARAGALGGAAMLGVTKAREGRVAPQVREVRRRPAARGRA